VKNIKITRASDIGQILDYVHDRIFQLSDINFDKERATLSIPLTVVTDVLTDRKDYFFVKTWKNPVVQSGLIISNVKDYMLKDEAEIGEANINTIVEEDGCVVIKCSVPVEIRAAVSELDIELQMTDEVIEKISRISLEFKKNRTSQD